MAKGARKGASIEDTSQVTDDTTVELLGTLIYPCSDCGAATKENHVDEPGDEPPRVCPRPTCRATFEPGELTPMPAPKEGPVEPCEKCGSETKEDHRPRGWPKGKALPRVCSNRECRHQTGAA